MKITIESNILRHLLKDAYFITGTAYAGKSTMVRLLSQKHDGIECRENYHDVLMDVVDPAVQPHMGYFETMSGWQEFVTRTPEQYEHWMLGIAREATEMEIALLLQLSAQGKKMFVDTNIPLEILHRIAMPDHVAVMLSPQSMSVNRFFDRPDAEKQFLYQELLKCPDPEKALANFRACLERLNSPERYQEYAQSGFFTWVRTEESTVEEALHALEKHFQLG